MFSKRTSGRRRSKSTGRHHLLVRQIVVDPFSSVLNWPVKEPRYFSPSTSSSNETASGSMPAWRSPPVIATDAWTMCPAAGRYIVILEELLERKMNSTCVWVGRAAARAGLMLDEEEDEDEDVVVVVVVMDAAEEAAEAAPGATHDAEERLAGVTGGASAAAETVFLGDSTKDWPPHRSTTRVPTVIGASAGVDAVGDVGDVGAPIAMGPMEADPADGKEEEEEVAEA